MDKPEIGQSPADQPELQSPMPDRIGESRPEQTKETPLQPPVTPIEDPMSEPPLPLPNDPATRSESITRA
jgi:hypothetical protein